MIGIDPTQLIAWATAGESETMELKRTTGELRDATITLCAMLNHRGGRVMFGVGPDHRVIGQDVSDHTLDAPQVDAPREERLSSTIPATRSVCTSELKKGNLGSFWLILAHSGSFWLILAYCGYRLSIQILRRFLVASAVSGDRAIRLFPAPNCIAGRRVRLGQGRMTSSRGLQPNPADRLAILFAP